MEEQFKCLKIQKIMELKYLLASPIILPMNNGRLFPFKVEKMHIISNHFVENAWTFLKEVPNKILLLFNGIITEMTIKFGLSNKHDGIEKL